MTGPSQSIWERERISLKQFSFIVTGRQSVPGGEYRYFGYAFGPWVFLRRKDYGVKAVMSEGFPENVAPKIEGRVMLKLYFKLSSDRLFLNGQVTPYKIEFYEDGSGIKSATPQEPIVRNYRRAELTPVPEQAEVANLGKPAYDV
ncbi:MAG: hypothetical protein JKY15_03585 [Deltaproteobacteria bacterium]|nr:hypothetical protein [Deltaproteobacteria bacterium]